MWLGRARHRDRSIIHELSFAIPNSANKAPLGRERKLRYNFQHCQLRKPTFKRFFFKVCEEAFEKWTLPRMLKELWLYLNVDTT